ncbi:MAG: fluoride efflux transporter CrcB [Alphaproteobacteria bacterium]
MEHFFLVVVGGGIGAGLRHLVGLVAMRLFGTGFPWGTLSVNIAGSFAMGLLIAWLALKADLPAAIGGQNVRLFLATGVLGGFTTFSAFSLETVLLWERGQTSLAATYVGVSVVVSIAALLAGLAVIRAAA